MAGAQIALFVVAALAAPGTAAAATTCDYSGGLLDVQLPASGDAALLSVADGGEIHVSRGESQVFCGGQGGPPTVSNTNVISIVNGPDATGNEVYITGPSRFAPGANTLGENGGTPEIEISVNLNSRPETLLTVGGNTIGVPIRFGASGINTNAVVGEVQADADIFYAGVPEFGGVADAVVSSVLTAQGGAGTGGALTAPITLYGGAQEDVLIGGERADELDGYGGSDTLLGGGGDDVLEVYAAPGDSESIDGGTGIDEAVVQDPVGVTVDLAIAGPQRPGAGGTVSLAAVENLTGTDLSDVLNGNGEANTIRGGLGDDVLDGRGGVDRLEGGAGADSLFVRDGGADSADCGAEIDTVTADASGVDTLTDCDNVRFPEVIGPGGSGQAVFGPDTLVRLSLASKRIRATGPVRVRVANGNVFEVSGSLGGRWKRAKLARRHFTLAGNAKATVKLRLPKRLRRVLERKRKLALRLAVSVTDPAGNARTVSRNVTPKLRGKKSRRRN